MIRTSRGIGLQFVKQLTAEPENVVIASCRNPESAQDLQDLKKSAKGELHIIKLEVTDEDAIKAAAAETSRIVGANGLDYLLNNAAIVSSKSRSNRLSFVKLIDVLVESRNGLCIRV